MPQHFLASFPRLMAPFPLLTFSELEMNVEKLLGRVRKEKIGWVSDHWDQILGSGPLYGMIVS